MLAPQRGGSGPVVSHDLVGSRAAIPLAGTAVTVLRAPRGYGKTTFVAHWARRRSERGETVVWVAIDRSDDPVALGNRVLSAVWDAVRADNPAPPPRSGDPDVTGALASLLRDHPVPVRLVFDDVDLLTDPASHAVLERLLARLPAGVSAVACTRPERPLALREVPAASEITAHELAFTATEAEAVVREHGVHLRPAQLGELMTVTEGWPAGVRLAAIVLSAAADPAAEVARLPGLDPVVTDYLANEVLDELTAEQRHVLLCTAVPDRFDAECATTLCGMPQAPSTLAELARTDFLVRRCGGQEYRQHNFIRAHLRALLRWRSPARPPVLHELTARWLVGKGRPAAALPHVRQSGNPALMAEVVARHGPELLLRGESSRLLGIATGLPPEALARGDIGLVLVLAEILAGDRAAAEIRLTGLAEVLSHDEDPAVADLHTLVRAHWARLTGHPAPATSRLDALVSRRSGRWLRTFALLSRGTAAFWSGDHGGARRDLELALDIATEQDYDLAVLRCVCCLAAVSSAEGDFPRMRDTARRALAFAAGRGRAFRSACCFAYLIEAWAAYQFVQRDEAREYVSRAAELVGSCGDRTVEACVASLVEVLAYEQGTDPHAALVRLRSQWARLRPSDPVQPALVAYEAVIEQRMALGVGRADWAAELPRRAAGWLGESGDVLLMHARLHVHHGQVAAARALLHRVTRGTAPATVVTTLIEAHLLAAALAHRAGDHELAAAELASALAEAEPRRALRPFVGAGAEVRALLTSQTGLPAPLHDFVTAVLGLVDAGDRGAAVLTRREVRLLHELPTLATVEEIAASLYVSVNTVKTHLRHVYQKLGVRSRREAVDVARRRGLL